MSLGIKEKIALQREGLALKTKLKSTTDFKEKIALQKQWLVIVRKLKGESTGDIDEKGRDIEAAANEAATSEKNDLPEPTEKQKLAGNYKKGELTLFGLDLVIENPKGSTRSGTSEDGSTWSTLMHHHYGDIKRTRGADGDPVDVFIGDNIDSNVVFIVDQINPESRSFDEHKVMLGFDSINAAKKAYLSNYQDGWQGIGAIKEMTLENFKKWVNAGEKTDPIKYRAGSFNKQEPKQVTDINFDDYVKLTRDEVKRAVVRLSEQGAGLQLLTNLLAHWLIENEERAAA